MTTKTLRYNLETINDIIFQGFDYSLPEKTMKLNIRNPASDISELEYIVIKAIKKNIKIFGTIEEELRVKINS